MEKLGGRVFAALLVAAVMACGWGASALAQGPPKFLLMAHEQVHTGKEAAYQKNEAEIVRIYSAHKMPVHYIGTNALSGPSEAVFFDPAESFAEMEQEIAAIGGIAAETAPLDAKKSEFLTPGETVVARYNEELSYRPPTDLGRARYFEVVTFRARPGHESDWWQIAEMYKGAAVKGNIDAHWMMYDAILGAPDGTHFEIKVHKSLAELDSQPARAQAFRAALGPEGGKKAQELFERAMESLHTDMYIIDPVKSYPPDEWVRMDPEFWKPKR